MKKSERFYIGLIYFTSMVSVLAVRILFAYDALAPLEALIGSDNLFTLLTQVICMGAIPGLMYLCLKRRQGIWVGRALRQIGFYKPRREVWKYVVVISLFSTFITTFVSLMWSGVLSLCGYKYLSSSGDDEVYNLFTVIGMTVMTAGLPAVFEEFSHRGLLRRAYPLKKDAYTYILVSALLFGLLHQNIIETVYSFCGGLVMAGLVYVTGSIYPSVLYHFLNNFIAVLLQAGARGNVLGILPAALYGLLLGTTAGQTVSLIIVIIMIPLIYRLFVKLSAAANPPRPVKIYDTYIYATRLDDLSVYGKPEQSKKPSRGEKAFFAGVIVMNTLATAMSFVWGVLR